MTEQFIAICWTAAALGYGGVGVWAWLKSR